MNQGWIEKPLVNICQIELGKTPYRGEKKYWDTTRTTNHVWLSIADLLNTNGKFVIDSKEYLSKEGAAISKTVKQGTLLLSFKLTIGRMAFAGKDLFTNEAIAALSIKNEKEILKEYLYYFLTNVDWNALTEGDVKLKGKTLNKAKLSNITISYPLTLPEQQRIVDILDEAFAAIDQAIASLKKNLIYINNILTSCLDDVEGTTVALKDLVNIRTGKLDANAAEKNGQYPFFTCAKEIFSINSFSFDCEAILLAGNNAVGDFNVKHYKGKFDAYQRTYVITIKDDEKIRYRYLYYQMLNGLKGFKEKAVGANTRFLKLGIIEEMTIPLPSVSNQDIIINRLDRLTSLVNRLEILIQLKIDNLGKLKLSLMQKAFNGEL